VRLWDLETITPEPVQNDPQLLQDLLLESIAIGGLAKKYAKPYTQKFENKKRIEELMKDHEYIKNMIAAYQAGLDEHEREDEMLLF
jgi:ribosomal protein S17E